MCYCQIKIMFATKVQYLFQQCVNIGAAILNRLEKTSEIANTMVTEEAVLPSCEESNLMI